MVARSSAVVASMRRSISSSDSGCPSAESLVDGVLLDHVNRLEMLDVVEDGGEHVMKLPGFGDGDAAVRVFDDPTRLLCRIGLVDGDELCPDCPDGLVEEGELIKARSGSWMAM